MKYCAAYYSDIGIQKETNQDFSFWCNEVRLRTMKLSSQ